MRRSTRARPPRDGAVKTSYFPLKGGLNLVDAPITMPPGMVLAATNYELLPRDGYRRVDGFERYDGQASPSDETYYILDYDGRVDAISEGMIVEGANSGATAVLLVDAVDEGTITNECTDPEAFSGASWNNISVTVTDNTDTSPNQDITADTLVDNNASFVGSLNQILSGVDTAWPEFYCFSVFIKKDTDTTRYPAIAISADGDTLETVRMLINTQTGASDLLLTATLTADNYDSGVIDYSPHYWRAWVAIKSTFANNLVYPFIYPALSSVFDASIPDATLISKGIVGWGAQLEQGADPSGYVATSGSYGYLVLSDLVGSFVDNEELGFINGTDEFNLEFSSEFA